MEVEAVGSVLGEQEGEDLRSEAACRPYTERRGGVGRMGACREACWVGSSKGVPWEGASSTDLRK